jgi:hypothetical protein
MSNDCFSEFLGYSISILSISIYDVSPELLEIKSPGVSISSLFVLKSNDCFSEFLGSSISILNISIYDVSPELLEIKSPGVSTYSYYIVCFFTGFLLFTNG